MPASSDFKDHFSDQSAQYARHRPHYPAELFRFLAKLTTHRRLARDCATGSGQTAVALSKHFDEVIATDASAAQIDAAVAHTGVSYRVAGAEDSGLELDAPTLNMQAAWSAPDMLGYLRTWSACNRYERTHGRDPVAMIEEPLRAAWGTDVRTVRWPLTLRVSRFQGCC